jgi:hypothetical protein
MDSCSESPRISEDSESFGSFNDKKESSSRSAGAKAKKSGGHGTVSPDGAERWGDDDEQTSPQLRARAERRSLLSSEAREHPAPLDTRPVPSARSSSLLSALPQNGATTVKSKPSKSCATSSLVSESPEQSDFPLTAKKPLFSPKSLDRRKSERHQLLDSAHSSASDRNFDAPSEQSQDGQHPLPNSPVSYRVSQEKSKQSVPPRSSSLAAKNSPQPRPGGVQAQAAETSLERSPGKSPPQKVRRLATPDELQELQSVMRDRAMSDYKDDPKINRFETLFTDERYAHISGKSKFKALKGYVNPIRSENTSEQEQQRYYREVSQLYILNYGEAGATRLAEKENQFDQFDTREEKENFRNEVLENLIWKLTPNQRHGLREEFKGLYGNSVLRDDTNWMFFDTIIRSYEMDEAAQRELMKEVFSASRETRLHKRDALRDRIHKHLTPTQRNNLKRVCKERHDRILYSRLPLFQVIIREKSIEAMKDYLDAVYLLTSSKHHFKYLSGRCISNERNQEKHGNAAFFNMVQWGTVEMMTTFLSYVLHSETISFENRFYLLSSYRLDDQISAFHMIMAAGDFRRARAFVHTITAYFDGQEDYFDAHLKTIPERKWRLAGHPRPSTNNDLCAQLLLAHAPAPERSLGRINAYTRAVDHGYEKCAKRFSDLISPMWRYFKCYERDQARKYNKIKNDANGKALPEFQRAREARIKRVEDGIAKDRAKMSPEERQKRDDNYDRWWKGVLEQNAADRKILEDRKEAIEEGRPISAVKTVWERHMEKEDVNDTIALRNHATLAYLERDMDVARDNRRIVANRKRKENPSPLLSAAKRLSSSFRANPPATTPTPEKRQKARMPHYHSPSIYITYGHEKNPDGSPKPRKPRTDNDLWLGEAEEKKKQKKQNWKVSLASEIRGYKEVGEHSEGG